VSETYTITQEQMDRLHGAAHSGGLLGGQAAYEGCLKVGAILSEIAFKEGFDKSPGSAPEDMPNVAYGQMKWPKALNVTRHADNSWHGDISFARLPTDEELKALHEFLRVNHEGAVHTFTPAQGSVESTRRQLLADNIAAIEIDDDIVTVGLTPLQRDELVAWLRASQPPAAPVETKGLSKSLFDSVSDELHAGHILLDRLGAPRETVGEKDEDLIYEMPIDERIAALHPQCSAGSDYVTVPVVPTEVMWGGLARDIIMWTRFDRPSQRSLLKHLASVGTQIPDWLATECRDIDHVPPKGSVAVWVYRAMLDARPLTANEPQEVPDTDAVVSAARKAVKAFKTPNSDRFYGVMLELEKALAVSRPHGGRE